MGSSHHDFGNYTRHHQPVISGLVWTVAIFALLRTFKVLAKWNLLITIFIGLAILFSGAIVFFHYQKITNSSFFEYVTGTAITLILLSVWLSTLVFELSSFLPKRIIFYSVLFAKIVLISFYLRYLIVRLLQFDDYDWLLATIDGFTIVVAIFIGLYLGWQGILDRRNYRVIRDRGVFFCHLFKPFITEFQGANLSAANFSFARRQNANFQKADLTHACWYGATKLETCRFGKSYLRYPSIRKLLSKPVPTGLQQPKSRIVKRFMQKYRQLPKSIQKFICSIVFKRKQNNFEHLDLQGIRLSYWNISYDLAEELRALRKGLYFNRGSVQFWICFPTDGLVAWLYPLEFWHNFLIYNLANNSFAGSNLCHAGLRGANFTNVNFAGSKFHATDLRDTNLTGICIQDMQVFSKNYFEGSFCKWLYLEKSKSISIKQVSVSLPEKELNDWIIEGLLMGGKNVAEIENIQNKITEIKNEFNTIDLIKNRVNREYRLDQFAHEAAEKHHIDTDLYRKMLTTNGTATVLVAIYYLV